MVWDGFGVVLGWGFLGLGGGAEIGAGGGEFLEGSFLAAKQVSRLVFRRASGELQKPAIALLPQMWICRLGGARHFRQREGGKSAESTEKRAGWDDSPGVGQKS